MTDLACSIVLPRRPMLQEPRRAKNRRQPLPRNGNEGARSTRRCRQARLERAPGMDSVVLDSTGGDVRVGVDDLPLSSRLEGPSFFEDHGEG